MLIQNLLIDTEGILQMICGKINVVLFFGVHSSYTIFVKRLYQNMVRVRSRIRRNVDFDGQKFREYYATIDGFEFVHDGIGIYDAKRLSKKVLKSKRYKRALRKAEKAIDFMHSDFKRRLRRKKSKKNRRASRKQRKSVTMANIREMERAKARSSGKKWNRWWWK